jgi:hypothetical protein
LFEELDLKITDLTNDKSQIIIRPSAPVNTCSRALCSQTSPKYCC